MRLLAFLVILVTLAPASALATTLPAPDAPAPVLHAALQDEARLAALAAAFPAGAGLAAQLETASGHGALAPPADLTFEDAMRILYANANVALPSDYARPESALAAPLAPVLWAVATAGQLTDDAFSALASDERAFLMANLNVLLAPTNAPEADELAARVQGLASRVNAANIQVGAATLASALDGFSVGTIAATWSAPGGLVEVGSTGDDTYCAERLLIIDLGGNDLYDCHAASYAPGSTLPLPVSAILDLGGNDRYQTSALHASSLTSTWGQAVGIGGIGIIADRWGDDFYSTWLYDAATYCDWDFFIGAPQTIYAQGVGALGVGALLDASGNDYYSATNVNDVNVNCHFGWVYTFAQGVGLTQGVGLLVDDTGDDVYSSYSMALGKYDNIAAVFSQAAAAGGVGILADKEGSDWYYAQADGFITFGFTKGAFAYVFSQASVTATRRQPTPVLPSAGAAAPAAINGICPAAGREGTPGLGGSGGCDAAGVALLLDLLGNDNFDARAYADDLGNGCYNGLWSVVSAQGSAAWSGLAALVNLDVEGSDSFRISPYASGKHCGGPGVRAHAYGQGYGGPVLWDFWDLPQPAGVEQLPVGILANLGVPEETCPGSQKTPRLPVGGTPIDDIIALPAPVPGVKDPCPSAAAGLPHLTASPDAHEATATAVNPGYIANAETWVQGAAGRSRSIPAYWQPSYPALGIGVHLDIGGDDSYRASADASGPMPDALVYAQGATRDAIAALANVGGDDVYDASAAHNGVPDPTRTLVQGYAEAATGLTTPGPVCAATSLILVCVFPVTITAGGIAIFADVFGYDAYSEAPERFGCQGNGSLIGTWPVGLPLGPVWWGTVIGTPCATPTPDVGSGTVVGLDFWSEAD